MSKRPSRQAPGGVDAKPPPSSPQNGRRLLTYAELQPWQQDNAYILTGYRPASSSIPGSLRSILYLHNESVNITTHALGALFFAAVALTHTTLQQGLSLRPFIPFYAGAFVCLQASALFHATSNVSHTVACRGNQIDYLGILALIIGSVLSSEYWGFACHPTLRALYATKIVLVGIACAVVTVDVRFRTPAWRAWRAGMFVAMGLTPVVPVAHGLKLYGWASMDERIGLRWLLAQGGLYIAGAGIYAMRVPEKWWPRRFDLYGSSHQIFHVFVVTAACVHWTGLLKAARHGQRMDICEDII